MRRLDDLDRFYDLLADLERAVGGMRSLRDCTGYMDWPDRGIYFFFAPDESRDDGMPRLTRIGTHAVSSGSGTALWDRLRAHRGINSGTFAGGGNHRGSVFRKRVGEAICERDGIDDVYPEWGSGSSADREVRLKETGLERRVTEYVGALPVLWLAVDDEPSPESDRAYIERNALALVSNSTGSPTVTDEDDTDRPLIDGGARSTENTNDRSAVIPRSLVTVTLAARSPGDENVFSTPLPENVRVPMIHRYRWPVDSVSTLKLTGFPMTVLSGDTSLISGASATSTVHWMSAFSVASVPSLATTRTVCSPAPN